MKFPEKLVPRVRSYGAGHDFNMAAGFVFGAVVVGLVLLGNKAGKNFDAAFSVGEMQMQEGQRAALISAYDQGRPTFTFAGVQYGIVTPAAKETRECTIVEAHRPYAVDAEGNPVSFDPSVDFTAAIGPGCG